MAGQLHQKAFLMRPGGDRELKPFEHTSSLAAAASSLEDCTRNLKGFWLRSGVAFCACGHQANVDYSIPHILRQVAAAAASADGKGGDCSMQAGRA